MHSQRSCAVRNSREEALAIAIDHPALGSDAGIVCRAAHACRGWREVVQCGAAGFTNASLKPDRTLASITGLSQWLAKHTALVRSLTIRRPGRGFTTALGVPAESYEAAAAQLLVTTLQLAAVPANPLAGTTAATAQPYPRMRLQAFSINYLITPAVLAALPAATLTHLDLDLSMATRVPAGVATALANLSNLQHLAVAGGACCGALCTILPSISRLSQLTTLEVSGNVNLAYCCDLHLLLREACELWRQRLQVLRLNLPCDAMWSLDLSRLNGLQQLRLAGCKGCLHLDGASVGSHDGDVIPDYNSLLLPTQLQQLDLQGKWTVVGPGDGPMPKCFNSSAVKQLQRLTLLIGREAMTVTTTALLQLTAMPALQHLSLQYKDEGGAADHAVVWKTLPALACISIKSRHMPGHHEHFEEALEGLSSATQLTSLHLERGVFWNMHYNGSVCKYFTRLTRLERLSLNFSSVDVPCNDCLALTSLTGLTYLDLAQARDAVGDNVAVALACNLKQLRHLDLQMCSLGHCACTAAIAHLSQLTYLSFAGNDGLGDQQLMQLTLQKLEKLVVYGTAVSSKGKQTFWSALRDR